MLTLQTQNFSWHGDLRKFLAEASDLAGNLRRVPSCFNLVSEKSGDTIRMYCHERKIDAEGEILSWLFYPEGDYVTWSLVIFND